MSNLAKLLSRGNSLAQQGDLRGALTELQKAIRDHGRRAEPWISLAAVHGMNGNFTESAHCARKAVELAPNSLQAWINLANAALSSGDTTQAVEAFQHAHNLPGCPTTITLDLARTLSMQGESEKAIAIMEGYCREHPEDTLALTQLGMVYLESGRTEDGWRICDQLAKDHPDEIDVLTLKSELLMFDGRYVEARDVYEQLLQKQQNNSNPRLFVLASQASRESGHHQTAVAYARMAVELDPNSIPALTTLCLGLLATDPAGARKIMEQALAIAPDNPKVMHIKGRVLEFEGDKRGAWECVRAIIESGSPDTESVSIAASVAPTVGNSEEIIQLLDRLLENPEISVGQQRNLRFTLAQLCDKTKQYDRAFKHAVIANKLKNAGYNHNTCLVGASRLKTVYSSTSTQTLRRSSNYSDLPIFIVGMPRSGTSLLEQILSCHSKVHARGETTDIRRLVEKIPYYPDGVRDLTQEKLDAHADTYLRHLRKLAPSASRITDKMPGNYTYLGVISQVLPGARILNCRRDPRDICLSQFMIEFAAGGLSYAYNLESLALVYKDYLELMNHWKTVLPIPIMDVRYEDLIADPQTWIGKVLDFCELDWEDACLSFHNSKRPVITASYDQVRRPLYKSSVARWKNYERHLEPVNRLLELTDDSYP